MPALVDAALWYAKNLNWPVFPVYNIVEGKCACGRNCVSPGKHPMTPNGVYDATTDEEQIIRWWTDHPDANIAGATGTRSRRNVLDEDPRNGGDESLEALLEQHGPLPDTVTARTGGGGRHFYFQANGASRTRVVAPGIDFKGDNGYVLLPPSNHISGGTYSWLVRPKANEELPALPAWLSETGLHELAEPLETTLIEGGRNDALTSFAGTMRRRGAPEETIVVALLDLNQRRCSPPLDEDEVRAIARSVAKYTPPPVIEPKNEIGNSRRLAARYGADLRYSKEWGWLIWDGKRWQRDKHKRTQAYAIKTVEAIYQEIPYAEDETEQKELAKHAKASQNKRMTDAMLSLAESMEGIVSVPEDYDQDPWLINVENGTIDLRTADVRPHDRADALTTLAPVRYDPGARCPRFLAFLGEIFEGNQELIGYLQRWFGYCLTGDTREQIFLMFYGLGANGKTTLLGTINDLMGKDYSQQSPPGLLIAKRNEGHPTELADLYGSRLVITSETGRSKRLAEDLLKQLVGGEKIKARFMRQDFFEFQPTFKLVLMVNNEPIVSGQDTAIWRRIKKVPFLVQIPEARWDRSLRTVGLASERSGILNWLLEGCLLWQRQGLAPEPEIVRIATGEYREATDTLAEFFQACCYLAPDAQTNSSRLYKTYEAWSKATGDHRWMSRNAFGRSLTERGLALKTNGEARFRLGIGLKNDGLEVI